MEAVPKRFVNIQTEADMTYLYEELKSGNFEYLAFDTETTGLDRLGEVFGFSICVGTADKEVPGKTYWYRFSDYVVGSLTNERIDLDTFAEEVLRYLFQECDKRIIMHNAKFDIRMVKQTFDIDFRGQLNDTMLLSQCVRTTNFHGLKPLAQYFLKTYTTEADAVEEWFRGERIPNKDKNFADVPDEIMFPYACADSELTYKLFWRLRQEFKKVPKTVQAIYLLERATAPVTALMEYNGMVVDIGYFQRMELELSKIHAELAAQIPVDNPNSNEQIAKYLFGKDGLNLKPIAYTDNGQPKVDAKALGHYRNVPEVAACIAYNKVSKILGSFVRAILEKSVETEPGIYTIHTEYNQIITTGRYSSKNINLQQMPNDSFSRTYGQGEQELSIRRGFITPPDYLYAKLDYAAFELRIIGNASLDPIFNAMILDGVDMHSWLAVKLYDDELERMNQESAGALAAKFSVGHEDFNKRWGLNWKYWAITSKSTPDFKYMRTMVKICSFQVYYGSGPKTISDMHGISQADAARLRSICFSSFKKVAAWREEIVGRGTQTGVVYTLLGRKCVLNPKQAYTKAVNYKIQGTAADLLKLSTLDIYHKLRGMRSKLVATIHDEVQLYIHRDELEVLPELIDLMEQPRLDPEQYPLTMLAELSMSNSNWADMKDYDHLKLDVVEAARSLMSEN